MNDLEIELAALGQQAARAVTTAELHGAACGLAVADTQLLTVEQLVELLGAEAVTDAGSVESFIEATLGRLTADDMSFAPLLLHEEPSEFDANAGEALATALSGWCSAFLAGLSVGTTLLGGVNPEQAAQAEAEAAVPQVIPRDTGPAQGVLGSLAGLPEEALEIVSDFIAIAQLDTEVTLDDDTERAMLELEEYVKVAVLLLGNLLQRKEEAAFDA